MLRCEMRLASSSSCLNRMITLGSFVNSGCRILSATVRPSSLSWALYTFPMPPSPSNSSIRNRGPKSIPGSSPPEICKLMFIFVPPDRPWNPESPGEAFFEAPLPYSVPASESPFENMSFRPIPEGVLLRTCEFFQSSACGRVPPTGKLPRLDPPTAGPEPGRFGPGSFGWSASPGPLRSTFSSVLFSSGRGNGLPQLEQRWERAGFSTLHDGHFITEGWPTHGQLSDYPARPRERQEVSCADTPGWLLQTRNTLRAGKGRKSHPFYPVS